jgi:hypothetical protein
MFNEFPTGATLTAPERPRSKSEKTLELYEHLSQEQQVLLNQVMNMEGLAEDISNAIDVYHEFNEGDADEKALHQAFEDFQSSELTSDDAKTKAKALIKILRK